MQIRPAQYDMVDISIDVEDPTGEYCGYSLHINGIDIQGADIQGADIQGINTQDTLNKFIINNTTIEIQQ